MEREDIVGKLVKDTTWDNEWQRTWPVLEYSKSQDVYTFSVIDWPEQRYTVMADEALRRIKSGEWTLMEYTDVCWWA